jgi:DivIVA domain-containing protein
MGWSMPLTPEEIKAKTFTSGFGRGYDRREVEAFLAQVADDYEAAIERIVVAAHGGLDRNDDIAAEVGEVLRVARQSAQRMRQKAQEAADGLIAGAEQRAGQLRAKAERTQSEARVQAEAKARQIVAEAERKARDLLEVTEGQCRDLIEEAERKARDLLEVTEGQCRDLIEEAKQRHAVVMKYEQQLRNRIGSLEVIVNEMRSQIKPVVDGEQPTRRRQQAADEELGPPAGDGSAIVEESKVAVERSAASLPEQSTDASKDAG